MKPPTSMARFIATPRIANTLYVLCVVLVAGWFVAGVPWWVALVAALAAGMMRDCLRRVRSYDAWLARWQSMGE